MSNDEVRMTIEQLTTEFVKNYGWGDWDVKFGLDRRFTCEYCHLYLLSSLDAYKGWQKDHLLPKSVYEKLTNCPSNWVLSCGVCNYLKGRTDVNRIGPDVYRPGEEFGQARRDELIVRARKFVEEQRIKKTGMLLKMRELLLQVERKPDGSYVTATATVH